MAGQSGGSNDREGGLSWTPLRSAHLQVAVADFAEGMVHSARPAHGPLVELHFQLVGEQRVERPGAEPMAWPAASDGMVFLPEAGGPSVWRGEGGQRFVTISCRPDLVEDALQQEQLARIAPLAQLLAGRLDGPVRASFAMDPRMEATVAAIVRLRDEGALGRLHAEAKVIELLCMGLRALVEAARTDAPPVLLSARDIERLHEARAILSDQIENPPTIQQLSRRVAVNQKKLKAGFKHLFGKTIFDFSLERRMEAAEDLLQRTDYPIGYVAMSVGYEYATSFTAAFKRYFGYLPKTARGARARRAAR